MEPVFKVPVVVKVIGSAIVYDKYLSAKFVVLSPLSKKKKPFPTGRLNPLPSMLTE
jgi:hypothetical protein